MLKRMEASLRLRVRPEARRTSEGLRIAEVDVVPVDAASLYEVNDVNSLTGPFKGTELEDRNHGGR